MSTLVFDIEADGLDPSRIWCLGILDFETDAYTAYVGEEEVPVGLLRLQEAEAIAGHYIKGYDIPVIERLTEGLVTFKSERVIDTCELSRDLFPELENHKLKTWGDILGYPKLDFDRFDEFSEEMLPYLERDCRLNAALLRFLISIITEGRE